MNPDKSSDKRFGNLHEILATNGLRIENTYLQNFADNINLQEDCCFFLYDLLSDQCRYFCPSITNLLGHDRRKYLNKGFLFFKTIIHPMDFLIFIDEILTLVKSAENMKNTVFSGNNSGVVIRIKHRSGNWTTSKIYLIYLKETGSRIVKILLGFIESDIPRQNNRLLTPANISSREKEILRYLSHGNSAKMIADRLCISENTVITHRKNLIQKLMVKNSAELIKRGFELNILD